MIKIKQNIDLPNEVKLIHKIFRIEGFELFLIGGAVRDAVLGTIPKDFDLVTNAVPEKVIALLEHQEFVTNILVTGKAFGVINVITNTHEFEIATMRQDVGSGRRPESVVFTNIETDILRRDLTCNALFFDIDTKEIVDLVGGVNDLKKGIVRTVGAAEDRFGEDRLRILRAIRFAGRFGSELDPATHAALVKDASLKGISGERIRDEFLKGIASAKSVKKFLEMIDGYKLFDWVFNGLAVDKDFIESHDSILVIAMILKRNNLDTLRKQLNELKYSVDEIKTIIFLISLLKLSIDTVITLKKLQKNSGVSLEQIKLFGSLNSINPKLLEVFLKFELTVTGPEAMSKFNIKPGPELGKAIEKMETDNFQKLL